jgi:hypothetical protein
MAGAGHFAEDPAVWARFPGKGYRFLPAQPPMQKGPASRRAFRCIIPVMAGLVPAIHVYLTREKTWMPATSARPSGTVCA